MAIKDDHFKKIKFDQQDEPQREQMPTEEVNLYLCLNYILSDVGWILITLPSLIVGGSSR